MDVNKVISKEGLKWKCREHPNVTCELIWLDGDAKQRVICFNCAQNHQIPFSNLISMSYVLAANENEILQAYPPLKDQELSGKLKNNNLQQQLEKIEGYFKKLREDFEKEVQAAQQKAKKDLIKQDRVSQELLEGYTRIAEIDKLKQLIVSEKESAEEDLDGFIKEKWNKAEENRKVIADLIDQNEGESYFSSTEPNKITQEIIQILKTISFFQQPIEQPQISFIKSTYNKSQEMEITKLQNSVYQVKKQGAYTGQVDQVFIDPILNPLKKYILQIELEMKPGNSNNWFLFGLAKDEGKDNYCVYDQNMCYYDYSNNFGITQYIKGNIMQSGAKVTGKHSFEVRIDLNQRFLRVASLPDYSSIAELDDPNKIDPTVAYRFFLSMINQGDMMRISNFRTVSKFDVMM